MDNDPLSVTRFGANIGGAATGVGDRPGPLCGLERAGQLGGPQYVACQGFELHVFGGCQGVEAVMPRLAVLRTFVLCLALTTQSPLALARPPTMIGTWTGTAAQNAGTSNYTVVITITSSEAETNYPELNCGGKLKRVGSANGYVFFLETITRGGKSSGGSCLDGAVTLAPAGANLAWGWVGIYDGKVW